MESQDRMHTEPYSDEFISEIIREFRIPEEHAAELKFRLEQAARIYRLSKTVSASMGHQMLETRKGLEHVDKTYSAFVQALESLSHHARDRLWDPAFSDPVRRMVPTAFAQVDPNNYPDEKAFGATLYAFGARIRERFDDFPEVILKSGNPGNAPLRYWVGLIARVWPDVTGRKFTYYQMPKKRSTFEFCWSILERIDGDVKPLALKTAMRSAIPRRSPEKRTINKLKKHPSR